MTIPELTEKDCFEAWLLELDEITYEETGHSYKDLPDQLYRNWFDEGLSPEDAYYLMMENSYPGVEISNIFYRLGASSIYTQEFDTFSDADPGL